MQTKNKRERILALDLLRGYFLSIIVVDHLGYLPSVFEVFSGRGQLWASAAEGFFMISGLLVGYIYSARMIRNAKDASIKIWKRAFQLYLWSIGLTYLFWWWGTLVGGNTIKAGLWIDPNHLDLIYKIVTMQYFYGWADFLQYYVLFMALSPLAVYLCIKKKGWLVILASFAIWLMRGQNFTMGMQFIFMIGLVVGYYLPQIESSYRGLSRKARRIFNWSLYGAAVVSIFLSILTVRVSTVYLNYYGAGDGLWKPLTDFFRTVFEFQVITGPSVDKFTMGPLRLVMAILWFSAAYLFFRSYEKQIDRITRGFLRTMGEHSLFVYALHAVFVFGLLIIWPRPFNFVLNTLVTAATLAAIYLITKNQGKIILVINRGLGLLKPGKRYKEVPDEI